jgi:hypothetical protein
MRDGRSFALLLFCSGCFQFSAEFYCESDRQCGHKGHCESTHFCSFDNTECASGRKYGDIAPSRYAGKCVVDSTDLAGVDLAGEDLAGEDLSAQSDSGADLAAKSDGGVDLATELTFDLSGPRPDGACGFPQLLVSVENLDTSGVGEVLRFQVPPYPQALVQCTSLNGSGQMGQFPQAVAPFGPNQIAVAGRDKLTIIDTTQDTVIASWAQDPNATQPLDVAPISHGGQTYAALALAKKSAGPYLYWLQLYQAGALTHSYEWLWSDLSVSTVVSMTTDTVDPTKLFIGDNRPTNPLFEETLDPFVPSTTDRGAALAPYGAGSLVSVSSIITGTSGMTAWVADNGVYVGRETAGGSSGPFQNINCGCSTSAIHAVPEPESLITVAIALCDNGSPNGRTIERQRLNSTLPGICSRVFNGATLTGNMRLTHLGYIYQQ